MTRRLTIYFLLLLPMIASLASCNKKTEEDPDIQEISYSNVAVNAFSLAKNDSVLARLDSVYFSIDLNKAVIFNADSLPKGTDVSHLVLKISLPSLSEAKILEPEVGGTRREFDYLDKTTDSIDFSHGDVTLHLVSFDKKVTRDYTIKVNVHKMVPDSLYWNRLAVTSLPGSIANPIFQKTVEGNGMVYCLVADGEKAELSKTSDPGSGDWVTNSANLPAGARVETFSHGGDTFYIVTSDGLLYRSDDATSWSSTGETGISWIYGEYNDEILAATTSGRVLSYPSGRTFDAPEGFPVTGTSRLLSFDSKWSVNPTALFIGGADAEGVLSADVWAFDGSKWAKASVDPLPAGLEGVALIPYFTFKTNSKTWAVTEMSTLVAVGGLDSDGVVNRKVYISLDNGLRWHLADQLMQLPDYFPPTYGADAIIVPVTFGDSRGASCWMPMAPRKLPFWWSIVDSPLSRAVKPVTEWECPYIYIFGGRYPDGTLCDAIWRGVINRLTFKPLQ